MKAQIVFASMTGNDEDMAEILEENLQDAGFDVENIDVSFADATSYLDADLCVMVTYTCLLYTSPSPRDRQKSRMPSSA